MPWCKKSKTYQLQKLEKAHQVLLSNHRKFEARYTKKAEGLILYQATYIKRLREIGKA